MSVHDTNAVYNIVTKLRAMVRYWALKCFMMTVHTALLLCPDLINPRCACAARVTVVGLCVCLFVCLSVCLFVCLSVCLFVCLSVCLFVCLSVCLFVCLSVCLFVCLSVDDYSRTTGYEEAYERYHQLQCYKGMKNNVAILLERLRSRDMIWPICIISTGLPRPGLARSVR